MVRWGIKSLPLTVIMRKPRTFTVINPYRLPEINALKIYNEKDVTRDLLTDEEIFRCLS
jgi:hypothetical protein